MSRSFLLIFLVGVGPLWTSRADASAPAPSDQPNILWITSEDNSAYWIGCYGNQQARTPRIDRLADEGVPFTRAYANAPVCAVARSVLLTGVHAVSQGTQHMRSRYPIPAFMRPYVEYLRAAGYYCTNNAKTDYNIRGNDDSYWDESSRRAHYRNRPPGTPFFAVFNLHETHESTLFEGSKFTSQRPRLEPSEVELPPLYPELDALRTDVAAYHEAVTAMDARVGQILDELQESGHADDTIVFYYSDHGGVLPRSKRYVYESGTHVPLVVRLPEKFAHLSPFAAGTVTDEMVSFVDFAPTLLSLAGITIPEHMQGRPFLGAERRDPTENTAVFLYGDRFDEAPRQHRAIVKRVYRYVHNFTPHLPGAPHNAYPYGIASWRAWRGLAEGKSLAPRHRHLWTTPQPTAEFYMIDQDPWELENLATSSEHARTVRSLRELLRETMLANKDLGMIPEPFWPELSPDAPMYHYVRDHAFPWTGVVDLAFLASEQDPAHLEVLVEGLQEYHPVLRYWAAYGCLALGAEAAAAEQELAGLLSDPHAAIRITAAHALLRLAPSGEALETLVSAARDVANDPAATLALFTLFQLGASDELASRDLKRIVSKAPDSYAARWAERFLQQRSEATADGADEIN